MSRLIKGVYGSDFMRTSSLFGLEFGQARSDHMARAAGWYNRKGEKIGSGDLSLADMRRVADGLEDDEMFIVLNPFDSFWGIALGDADRGGPYLPNAPGMNDPGTVYVANRCAYIIISGHVFYVDRDGEYPSNEKKVDFKNGLMFEIISPAAAWQLIIGR